MLVFFNPRSGPESQRVTRKFLEESLAAAGARARVVEVDGREISDALRELDPNQSHQVVAAGGDGTLCSVANAVIESPRVFGILPLGTRNHFARDLGLPLALDAAIDVLVRGRIAPIDTGEVNGRLFLNNASLGLYPRFVEERRRRMRRSARWFAILSSAWAVVRRHHHLEVRVDGATAASHASVVFIGNNRYSLQGLDMGERNQIDEGVLTLAIASVQGPWSSLRLMMRAATAQLEAERDFHRSDARTVRIDVKRRRVRVALDGEPMKLHSPLEFRVRPGALRLRLPGVAS